MRTIVVGYDGSESAQRALDRAVEIAEAFSARLVVVSVAEIPSVLPAPYAPLGPAAMGAPVVDEPPFVDVEPKEVVGRLLDEAKHRLQPTRVDAEFEARAGAPDEAIIEVAESRTADLIVVGTREPGFLSRILEGSVSDDLARRAHCDVLVVHAPRSQRRD